MASRPPTLHPGTQPTSSVHNFTPPPSIGSQQGENTIKSPLWRAWDVLDEETKQQLQLECQDGRPIQSMIRHKLRPRFCQDDEGPKTGAKYIEAQFTIWNVNITWLSPK